MDPGHREAEPIAAYLAERMVGYQILFDTWGLGAHVTLVVGRKTCHVEVDKDFYMGRDAATIRAKLEEWQIAEQLSSGARRIRIHEDDYEVLERYT
jgi:hypothetical protein